MKELRRLLERRPEVSLGVLVFAGFALGAGLISLPSLPLPRPPAPAAPTPAPGAAPGAATPGVPAADPWGDG